MGLEMFDCFEEKTPEIPEIDYSDIEKKNVEPDIRKDIPNVEKAIVIGEPEKVGKILDYKQGDGVPGIKATCSLTSIANICTMNGKEVTEGMVVRYALDNDLCVNSRWRPSKTGATYIHQQLDILKHYGFDAKFYRDNGKETYEMIAKSLAQGKGVIANFDGEMLWGTAGFHKTHLGFKGTNHAVTVTGAAIDATTGEVAGLYICDSAQGREKDACWYLSVEEFSKCSGPGVIGSGFVVTDDPIRKAR